MKPVREREASQDDLLLLESSDDDLRYSSEHLTKLKQALPANSERPSEEKRLSTGKEVQFVEAGSLLEDEMSSIRMSHDTTYDFIMDAPSELLKTSPVVANRSGAKEFRSRPSLLRSLRPSDSSDRQIYQSVSRINRKVEYDDFRTKSITFDKRLASVKSLKHILSLKKADRLQDFKEFFNDARTLIVYEQTIKLTMLLQHIRKDVLAITEQFERSLAQSERFVELTEQMKECQLAKEEECTHLRELIREKDEIIRNYEQLMDQAAVVRQERLAPQIPLTTSVQPSETFRIDRTMEKILLPRSSSREEQQSSYVTPPTVEISPHTIPTETRQRDQVEVKIFDHSDTTFVDHSHQQTQHWTEQELLLSFRENLQEVSQWFTEHSSETREAQAATFESSGFLQKVANAYFTLCKIINSNSQRMEEIASKGQGISHAELRRKSLKESLLAITNMSKQILTEAMQWGSPSPVLHRHLAEHEHFAKDLCRLCFSQRG